MQDVQILAEAVLALVAADIPHTSNAVQVAGHCRPATTTI